MIEDKLLIFRFKQASEIALTRIYQKYKDDLLRLATALLNNNALAEDVVHDCFIVFARSADKLKLTGNLKGYLVTSVANRARNLNKEENVRKTDSLDEALTIEAKTPRPQQWIIYSEQLRDINRALSQLPYDQREVVTLHINGKMKFKTIAKLQNVSINTAQSRYRYGLDKLRQLLDNEAEK